MKLSDVGVSAGASRETRTLTAKATAPSRLRVYQFHHARVFVDKRVLIIEYCPIRLILCQAEICR
jgi:hypothetical protein